MDELTIRLPAFEYIKSDNIMEDTSRMIELAQTNAYSAINTALVYRNWLIGRRITDEELSGGEGRAEYGLEIIKRLSDQLTEKYGSGFDRTNLYRFVRFYKYFPRIVDTACQQSRQLLSWSHYRAIIRVEDEAARDWYAEEAFTQVWSVHTLERNIASQYYQRIISTHGIEPAHGKTDITKGAHRHNNKEFIKSPVIAEFLGLPDVPFINETKLETAILSNLQRFMMELGKGYAFVARQKRIRTERKNYYVDLVFYNFILKCFVLIDLKTEPITHDDVGQLDMYVRMYDERIKMDDDNPTLGILLCSETDEDIARYSVLNGSDQLFATKYKLYLPSEEDLRAEIEEQKDLYFLQQNSNKETDR